MTIEHHVSDDLLLAYAAGTLDEAMSLLVATHLALCPDCRSALALAEEIGGALIETAPPAAAVDDAMIDAVTADPAGEDGGGDVTGAARPGPFVLPRPLRDYSGGDVADLAWRGIGGGIRQFPLKTGSADPTARLLSIPAGKGVPGHGHGGFEATMVLAGSFYDRGAWYRRGDVGFADESVVHRPVAGPEQDCICLAVTDARLKFASMMSRLLQPFHGI